MTDQVTEAPLPRPKRGDELELVVDALAFGGDGVARKDGYVVFVSGALPGDRVQAVLTERKRSYGKARVAELLEAGPERIEPVADHPGASWQILAYERQLEIKQEQVADALRRIGRLKDFTLDPIVPAVEQWRYRNKLEYSFGEDEAGQLICGFHAAGRWDQIEPVEDCLLASERSNTVRERALAWLRSEGLSAYDRRGHSGFLRNLVVREGRRSGQLQVRLVTSTGDFRALNFADELDVDGVFWTQLERSGETTAGGETVLLSGRETLTEELCGVNFAISSEAFFQTNTEMAEVLYETAREFAGLSGSERVFDLFCGTGTVGLALARDAAELWGVELVEEAVRDAITNAQSNGITHAHFFAGDVRLVLPELVERAGQPDVCVIDPPRSGLSQKVVRRVIELAPERIVYISCNPTTLAPNAAQLVEAGYRLERVRPVDMFPQTPHIECVALLTKN